MTQGDPVLSSIQLSSLLAVLRAGSFAEAAREIGYTGSAVAQQIAALERQLGIALFERDARGVRPTPAAVLVAERSAVILSEWASLARDTALLRDGHAGVLRVGAFPTAAARVIPLAISRIARQRPDVEVHLHEGEPAELVELLESGRIDVALVYRYSSSEPPPAWGAHYRPERLIVEDLLVVMPESHRLSEPDPVELDQLAEQPWISTRDGTGAVALLHRLCSDHGFEPTIAHSTNDYDVIHGLVASGLGIALVPTLAFRPLPGVSAAPLHAKYQAHRQTWVLRSPAQSSSLTDWLVQALRDSVRLRTRWPAGISVD